MVRKFAALFALILAFGMSAAPIAAQDVDTSDLSNAGLESGLVRMYMADPNGESDLMMVMLGGFQFDSADTLDENFEDFTCGFASGFFGVEDALDCDSLAEGGLEVTNVDDMGDNAIEFTGESDIQGPTPTSLLAIQDEDYLFLVISIGDATPGINDELGQFLVDAEPVDTEVMFSEDGTSTGGFYDMLPAEGDAVLEGLTPIADQDFMGTATPAASTPEA